MPSSRSRTFALATLHAALSTPAWSQPAPTVVSYAPPPAVHTLTASPAVRFGDEAMEYHRIVAIVPLSSGGLVVANGGTQQLRLFDRDGRLLREVGRRGGGPGEYLDISGVSALRNDSLVVWDGIARRVTVLDPKGGYVRTFPLEAPFEGAGSVMRVLALPSGDILIGFSEVRTLAPSPTAKRFGERLLIFTSDGKRREQAELRIASSDHFVQSVPYERGGVAYWGLAFGRSLSVRATASGIATGDGTTWRVETRKLPDLGVVTGHELSRSPAPVTSADIAAYRERALRGESGADRLLAERMVDEMPFPKTQPAFARFEVDERGRFWVADYIERRSPAPLWLRLDSGTGRASAVRFPARFEPRAFAGQMVYGILRDEDDVERVVAYGLRGLP